MSPTPAVTRIVIALERRGAPRFPLSMPVQYSAGKMHGEGMISEISSSGLFFRADRRLPAKIRVHLQVEWPAQLSGGNRLRFVMNGKVLRSNEDGIAVRLLASKGRFDFKPARAQSRAAR